MTNVLTDARDEQTSKATATRRRVLDAAAKLFNEAGYAAATMRDVADLAQMKAGSLYYHFKSKESLLDSVLDKSITELSRMVLPYLVCGPSEVPYRDRIARAIRVHLKATLELGDYAAASRRLLTEVPPDVRMRHEQARKRLGEQWRNLLEEARSAGEIREDFNLSLARLFLIGALNYTNEWYDRERGSVDDVADALIEMVFNGLASPAPGRR